jgi:hypothetical protein
MKKINWVITSIVVILLILAGYYIYNNRATDLAVTPPVVTPPVVVTPDPTTKNYTNSTYGYSLNYPLMYTVDENYKYQALGPTKTIVGTKFTIPASMATGTNLSRDTYISVEQLPLTKTCNASMFLGNVMSTTTQVDSGIAYSVAISSGAGAGNRYEETVYAAATAKSCMGVRYFVHYTVLENYPVGAVKQFDRQMLLDQFYAIRRSVVVK